MAERAGFYCVVPLPSPAAQCGPDRRGRPNALASVGFVPGAKARSAPQSCGLCPVSSLVRVTWCFNCSPHGSAGSTGHAEAVVGFRCRFLGHVNPTNAAARLVLPALPCGEQSKHHVTRTSEARPRD